MTAPARGPRPGAAGARRDRSWKRPFDLAALAVAGALFAPLWIPLGILIAAAVRFGDGGPVFHVQRRLGRGGRPFGMVKFRTMAEGRERPASSAAAAGGECRPTRVGRVLRRHHFDELPQAVNVLRGEMSLVGPRPERPELAELIERDVPGFAERLAVRPGLAGLAQARGTYQTSPRDKLRYDRLYIEAMSPPLDLKLLAVCCWKAVRPGRSSAPGPARLPRWLPPGLKAKTATGATARPRPRRR